MTNEQADSLIFGKKKRSLPIKKVAISLLVVGILFITLGAADFSRPQYEINSTEVVTVRSGDTLWSLSSGVGNIDTRRIIEDIRVLNGINPGDIRPGMKLEIPTYKEVK